MKPGSPGLGMAACVQREQSSRGGENYMINY